MNIYSKIKKTIKDPLLIVLYLGSKEKLKFISDKIYLKIIFKATMNRHLNLENPKTFNEKLQYLKLYDRNPAYTNLVDKFEVRKYISRTIGEEYLIPLIGVWDNFDEINFDKLPEQFVMKCNHDSGGVIICKDKSKLDIKSARKKINKSLKRNFFYTSREWPYKNVKPRIICEKYIEDKSDGELKDYKFFCFNGKPKALFIATDRSVDTRFDFYDIEFNHLPVTQGYKNSVKKIKKPDNFGLMITLASKLSKEIPHVRVDFYEVDGKVFFGELTFYHFAGLVKFDPEKYDRIFGDWIDL